MKGTDAAFATEARLTGVAHKLCADLLKARPAVYWADLLATAFVAYASLAAAMALPSATGRIAAGVICALAIYRGVSFIHEVAHLRAGDVPGFKAGYNILIGVPFLTPSLLYEGVHNLHHAKSRYGTAADPEYMPLARQTVWHVAAFIAVSALTPVGLLLRFAVMAPLAAILPPFRRIMVARFSALSINPFFRREMPSASQRRLWLALEAACSVWAVAILALTAAGWISGPAFSGILAIGAAVAVLNQVRTLAAHHWENDGAEMTATGQFLDSVNVPPPATLPALWAPVGLRYHALHHLLPRVPYHNLGRAHARLCEALPQGSVYHAASSRSLASVVGRLHGAIRRNVAGEETAAEAGGPARMDAAGAAAAE